MPRPLPSFTYRFLSLLCSLLIVVSCHPSLAKEQDRDLQTSTEKVNIWQKLKESIGLAIVGIILTTFTPCLIWKNEGRHVRELKRIDFCKNHATVIENVDSPGDETTGQMVYFTGKVQVDGQGLDFESSGEAGSLNVSNAVPNAVVLKRTCYIYQKFEESQTSVQKNRVGGGETRTTEYSIREDWTPRGPQKERLEHVDATNSRGIWDLLMAATVNDANHGDKGITPELPEEIAAKLGLFDNTAKPHAMAVAPSCHVGGFGLSRQIVLQNAQELCSNVLPVPPKYLPDESCDGLIKGNDNILRTYVEEEGPKNGDCKVVYEFVMDSFDASFIVKQTPNKSDPELGETTSPSKFQVDKADVIDEKCFGYCGGDYGDIWMVRNGTHTLEEMIGMAMQDEKNVTKIIRIVGWLLLMAGWCMLFAPFTTALQVLPILGAVGNFAVAVVGLVVSLTCCCTIMTTAYIRYRPLLAFLILLIAGGIWGLIAWRLNIAVEEGGDVDDVVT